MRVIEGDGWGPVPMDVLIFAKKTSGPKTKVAIRVPKSILEKAEKISKESGMNTSQALIYLMIQGLEKLEADKAKPKAEQAGKSG